MGVRRPFARGRLGSGGTEADGEGNNPFKVTERHKSKPSGVGPLVFCFRFCQVKETTKTPHRLVPTQSLKAAEPLISRRLLAEVEVGVGGAARNGSTWSYALVPFAGVNCKLVKICVES